MRNYFVAGGVGCRPGCSARRRPHGTLASGWLTALGWAFLAAFLPGSFWAADPVQKAPAVPGKRYLFIVETSRAMQPRSAGTLRAIQDLLKNQLAAELRPGDTLGLWTFNDEVHPGRFPLKAWAEGAEKEISASMLEFLQAQPYEKGANFTKCADGLKRIVEGSRLLTVILVSSGEPISGTPFDAAVNTRFQQWRVEQQKAKMPFITVMRTAGAKPLNFSVTAAPWDVELPPLPAELLVSAPAPKPPPPAVAQPLIVTGRKPAPAPLPTPTQTTPAPTNPPTPQPAPTPSPAAIAPAPPSATTAPSDGAALTNTTANPSLANRAPTSPPVEPKPQLLTQPRPTESTPPAVPGPKIAPAFAQPESTLAPTSPPVAPAAGPTISPQTSVVAQDRSREKPSEPSSPEPQPGPSAQPLTSTNQVLAVQTPSAGLGSFFVFGGAGLIIILCAALWIWRVRSRPAASGSLITASYDRKDPK